MEFCRWLVCVVILLVGRTAQTQEPQDRTTLTSGEYRVSQSWSQEESFERRYYVRVPDVQDKQRRLPVLVFLHGNGANARNAMRGFIRGRRKIAERYILVFPQGYRESWNIVSERSKANDVGFIESIVRKLAEYQNVDADNFTVMGASNGAALVNQLAIESRLPNIRNYISGVSQLNVWQYDGQQFKAKGRDNNYRKIANPAKGKRLLNISGVNDRLVPYRGGPSPVIPAKQGKLAFVDAEQSTFVWARHMGYQGQQLRRPTRTVDNTEVFSYLNGDVVHYKVTNEGHGATHGVSERLLLDFLSDEQDRDAPPLVLVHYMPWYTAKPFSDHWGWHWTMNHFDPEKEVEGKPDIASKFHPLIGPYDSGDPDVLEYHLLLMKLAGIDGVIVDWYGRADYRDYAILHRNTTRLLQQCERLKMKFVICYEDQTIPALVDARGSRRSIACHTPSRRSIGLPSTGSNRGAMSNWTASRFCFRLATPACRRQNGANVYRGSTRPWRTSAKTSAATAPSADLAGRRPRRACNKLIVFSPCPNNGPPPSRPHSLASTTSTSRLE